MSEREPITWELREAVEGEPTFCGPDRAMVPQPEFDRICDAIDAVHAGLERENAELRERLAVLDNRSESMHDGGSITDELRGWMDRTTARFDGRRYLLGTDEELTAIADRIDAEHQKSEDEWKAKDGQTWLRGYAECHAELMDGNEVITESLEKAGWVKLPVDDDGVPIRIGDEMEGVDKYDSLKEVMGKVITVSFESDGTTDVAIRAWDSDGKSWHRAYLEPYASVYRHHHEPTVEDVLREMLDAWGELPAEETNEAIVAEYAAKLQLREDS